MQPRRHGWYRTLVVRLLAALVVVAAVASATGPGDTNNNDHRALLSTSFTAAQIRAMLTESVVSGRASGSTSGSGNASGSGSGRADASGSGIATGAMVDETPEDAREPPAKRTRWSARLRGRSSTGDDVATPSSAEARPYNAKPFSFVPPSQLSPQPQRQPLRLSTIASDLHGNFFQRLSLRERYRFACLTTRAIRESPPFVAYCTAMEEARALCGNDRFEELFLGMKSDLETLMLTELRLTSNADGVHLSSSRSALPRGCLGAVHRTGARWAHIRQRMPTMELHLPVASDEEREEIAEFLWSGGAGVRAMLVYVHAHSAGDNEEEEGEGGPIGLQTDVEKRIEEGIEAVMRSVVDGGTVERVRIVNWPNWRLLLAGMCCVLCRFHREGVYGIFILRLYQPSRASLSPRRRSVN